MEKILSDDEKIRRAEEIYFRRNNQNTNKKNNTNNKKGYLKNKFFLHLLIMFNIAILVFCIQNREFIFTKQFLDQLNEYNVSISSSITNYLKKILSNDIKDETTGNIVENEDNNIEEINETTNNESEKENSSVLNEMDTDVKNLKDIYSFINPIDGVITSRYGIRESERINVTGYHTGIDIGANQGTLIKASMEGIVDLVSTEGDYGNHIKIRCNNVTTLYAHCQNVYVTEGQIVSQGQVIATVGSTGNSTGPHLHFEIRIDDRFVNPERILNL